MLVVLAALCTAACPGKGTQPDPTVAPDGGSGSGGEGDGPERVVGEAVSAEFEVQVDQFADLRVLRYRIPGFTELPLWYGSIAAFVWFTLEMRWG